MFRNSGVVCKESNIGGPYNLLKIVYEQDEEKWAQHTALRNTTYDLSNVRVYSIENNDLIALR